MRIRLLSSFVGNGLALDAGTVIEWPDVEASRMIGAGLAVPEIAATVERAVQVPAEQRRKGRAR